MIITLCGSTKFKHEFELIKKLYVSDGIIVFSPEMFSSADSFNLTSAEKEILCQLHFRKIELSDYVLIINQNGYVGEDTLKEILHAFKNNIPVFYLH